MTKSLECKLYEERLKGLNRYIQSDKRRLRGGWGSGGEDMIIISKYLKGCQRKEVVLSFHTWQDKAKQICIIRKNFLTVTACCLGKSWNLLYCRFSERGCLGIYLDWFRNSKSCIRVDSFQYYDSIICLNLGKIKTLLFSLFLWNQQINCDIPDPTSLGSHEQSCVRKVCFIC